MEQKGGLVQQIGNCLFMLLVLLFVADPTNTILGLKNLVFALLFIYSFIFFKADWSKLIYFLIPVITVSISWLLATMRGQNMDTEELKALYTAFVPLLLLMWVDKYDIVRLSVLPVTVAAVIVLFLFWLRSIRGGEILSVKIAFRYGVKPVFRLIHPLGQVTLEVCLGGSKHRV